MDPPDFCLNIRPQFKFLDQLDVVKLDLYVVS